MKRERRRVRDGFTEGNRRRISKRLTECLEMKESKVELPFFPARKRRQLRSSVLVAESAIPTRWRFLSARVISSLARDDRVFLLTPSLPV